MTTKRNVNRLSVAGSTPGVVGHNRGDSVRHVVSFAEFRMSARAIGKALIMAGRPRDRGKEM